MRVAVAVGTIMPEIHHRAYKNHGKWMRTVGMMPLKMDIVSIKLGFFIGMMVF